MSLDEDFASAVADFKKIKKILSNDELIEVCKPSLLCSTSL
jgi:hypothetical protein